MEEPSKSKTPLIAGIVAIVLVIAAVVGVIIIKNKNNGTTDNGSSDDTSQTTDDSNKISAADLANIDVEVEYGDYDAMEKLAKDIQNGLATDKVVKITGLVSHPMSKYSVVEPSADGTQKIGTEFNIQDGTNYPADGAKITITGKVVLKDQLYYIIQTLSDHITVVSAE